MREAEKVVQDLDGSDLLRTFKPLYDKNYIARVYVYTAINLAPISAFLEGGVQTLSPYLVGSNGPGVGHRVSYSSKAKKDELNPEFFQVFDLPTHLPENYTLIVQVWNQGIVSVMDDLIGGVTIDLETRLLQQAEETALALTEGRDSSFSPTVEYHDLKNPSARTSQGKLSLKLEVLTEEEARRTKPEDLQPPVPQEYELRMVIWSTRDVRFPADKDTVRSARTHARAQHPEAELCAEMHAANDATND
jgi:hypothetical protein